MTSSSVPKGSAVARYALEGLPEKAFGIEWKIALPGEESPAGEIELAQTQP